MEIRKLLDYVYPPRCPVCDRVSPEGICGDCRKKIPYIREAFCLTCGKPLEDEQQEYCADCLKKKHSFDLGRALFSYRGQIRSSLYRLKYGNKREYAKVYGREWRAGSEMDPADGRHSDCPGTAASVQTPGAGL